MNKSSKISQNKVANGNVGYSLTADQYHKAQDYRIIDVKSADLVRKYSLGNDARDAFLCVLPTEGGFVAWHHDKGYSFKALGVTPRRCIHCIEDDKFVRGRLAVTSDFHPEAVEDLALSRLVCALVGTMFYDLVEGKTVFCSLEILESMQYGLRIFKRFSEFPRFFAIDTAIIEHPSDGLSHCE